MSTTTGTTPRGETPRIGARVPLELLTAARRALGKPHATDTELIRAGLALLAGLDVERHAAPLPYGPRRAAA